MYFLICFVPVISTKVHPGEKPVGRKGDEKRNGKGRFLERESGGNGEERSMPTEGKEADS